MKFKIEDIPKEPLPLPEGFEWSTFDITNDDECQEICDFLTEHYVEDNLGNFRLYYSKDKFRWGVASPGFMKDMNFLIRNSKNKKILACIVGVPKKLVVNGKPVKVVEVNFLAIH